MAAFSVNLATYIRNNNPSPKDFDSYWKIDPSLDLYQENESHQTPFAAALSMKNLDLALHLIQKMGKEEVNRENSQGVTPLFLIIKSASNEKWESVQAVTTIAEALIKQGANVNQGLGKPLPAFFLSQLQANAIPKGTTPLWAAFEYATFGLALTLRIKTDKSWPDNSEWGKKSAQQVEDVLKLKKDHLELIQTALLKSDNTSFLYHLPLELKKKLIEDYFSLRVAPEDDAFDNFLETCFLANSTFSLISGYIKGDSSTHHLVNDQF
ncbi:MAG TPA: hypothetical protein VHA52_05955, partial [Candidatus Babeliaceae bacterium]|nr:hypothetical protein [Candidatus Babeliaceae bacterium]